MGKSASKYHVLKVNKEHQQKLDLYRRTDGGFQRFALKLKKSLIKIGVDDLIVVSDSDLTRMRSGWKARSGPSDLFASILEENGIRLYPEKFRSTVKTPGKTVKRKAFMRTKKK